MQEVAAEVGERLGARVRSEEECGAIAKGDSAERLLDKVELVLLEIFIALEGVDGVGLGASDHDRDGKVVGEGPGREWRVKVGWVRGGGGG